MCFFHKISSTKNLPVLIVTMNRPLVIEEGTLLLVGEGNFSFSVALQKQIVTGRIVSTSLLSEEALSKIHPTAQANIKHLKEKGLFRYLCV